MCNSCYTIAFVKGRLTNLRPVRTHGHATPRGGNPTPEYKAWDAMKYRCLTPTCKSYKNYGGRGITVCRRWLVSFDNFLADVGYRPSPNHSIGRIDNDGNYEPGNVRWETNKEQMRNRSCSKRVTWKGETHTIYDWAEIVNMHPVTLMNRLDRGWSVERALTLPSQVNSRHISQVLKGRPKA